MSKLKPKIIIGIDLEEKPKNPTSWTLWKHKKVNTSMLYTDKERLEGIPHNNPAIITVDTPFSFPKRKFLERQTEK